MRRKRARKKKVGSVETLASTESPPVGIDYQVLAQNLKSFREQVDVEYLTDTEEKEVYLCVTCGRTRSLNSVLYCERCLSERIVKKPAKLKRAQREAKAVAPVKPAPRLVKVKPPARVQRIVPLKVEMKDDFDRHSTSSFTSLLAGSGMLREPLKRR